jgi:hypothetical protein
MSMRFARKSKRIAEARDGCSAAFRCRIFSMSQAPDHAPDGMLLRLSAPAAGDLRVVVVDIAKRVAEYLREGPPDMMGLRVAIEGVASKVAPAANDAEIIFDFREINGELQIEAHCGSRSSEVRCPLPA